LDFVRREFSKALEASLRPVAAPVAVTTLAAGTTLEALPEVDAERLRKAAGGRFGPLFGSTVHRALELILGNGRADVPSGVLLAASEVALADHLSEAGADVERALQSVRPLLNGATVATEYPVVMARADGRLLSGFIDLLVQSADTISVIDFKTDVPLPGRLE